LAKDGATMKKARTQRTKKKAAQLGDRGLPIWPRGKALPKFKNKAAEVKFWHSYDFEPPELEEGEQLVYEPQATRHPRRHVYPLRLDDREMASLQRLAKQRGVPAAVVIRELVLSAARA
jgi:hypothetical protein